MAARRYHNLMTFTDRIELNPDIMLGKPVPWHAHHG